eukprot:COSAG06_NODE_2834_length_6204_cov_12.577396_2_plen_52_part_00
MGQQLNEEREKREVVEEQVKALQRFEQIQANVVKLELAGIDGVDRPYVLSC